MNKHCKGCVLHRSAGRRAPGKHLAKFNDWCVAKGAPADVGWCKTHDKKVTKQEGKKP